MSSRKRSWVAELLVVDKELIIMFLLVAITAVIFFFVYNQRAFLNFFYLPVLLGAYFFGRRYATLSAILTVLIVFIATYWLPGMFSFAGDDGFNKWLDIGTWGAFLLVIAYTMGLLYEKRQQALKETQETYHGIVEMLALIVDSVDQDTQSHSSRVSRVSRIIAEEMGFPKRDVEDLGISALLHDLGKIGVSRSVLEKVGALTEEERKDIRRHAMDAKTLMMPLGGKVTALLPAIIYHHERYDGTGYNKLKGEDIPLGARIIALADVYDALLADRPYRKALTPLAAKAEIRGNSGTHFDPTVVDAFERSFVRIESQVYLSHAPIAR